MLKHYLTLAWRQLLQGRWYSLVNIFGLSVGIAVCLLITIYVLEELSFDKHHKKNSQIYRLILERTSGDKISHDISVPPPMGPTLVNDFPQVAATVRFFTTDNPVPLVRYEKKSFYEPLFCFTDSTVTDVFTFQFLSGNSKTALDKPNSVIISEGVAKKYFEGAEPLGKKITFNNVLQLEVTGVIKDMPSTSSFNFDFLASFSTLPKWLGDEFLNNWQNNSCQTYILLPENFRTDNLVTHLPSFVNKHFGTNAPLKKIFLQPLNRIHLYSSRDFQLRAGGDIQYIYLLSALAIFILLIGCINFINLSTARSIRRTKEVGVRKVLGASKKQLIIQFIGESILITFISLFIALLLVYLVIPHISELIGRKMDDIFSNLNLWYGVIGVGLVTALLSGSYPAFVLSAFKPIYQLKDSLKKNWSSLAFRKMLVAVQFALVIFLMIGSWVIYSQLKFLQTKNLGFTKDEVIVIPIRDESFRQNPAPVTNYLRQQRGVMNVSTAALLPGGPVGKNRFYGGRNPEEGVISVLWVDFDFIQTLGMELVAGRNFSRNYQSDSTEAFIVNEQAVIQMGWTKSDDAIGKSFELVNGRKGKIIGVVKDFHFTSLHRNIEPIALHIWPWQNYFLLQADPGRYADILNHLKNIWQRFDPHHPFAYSFLDDNFQRYYRSEEQLGIISRYAFVLAVIVGCLGLFGLSALSAQFRVKEIGIRKVLGASVTKLATLLSIDFLKLVMIGAVIAFPLAWYTMNNWLEDFAYRITIEWWMFAFAGLAALLIALLAVSFQAIKAAVASPMKSLRTE